MNPFRRTKGTLVILVGLVLAGCTTALPPADPVRANTLHEEARQLTFRKDFPAAIGKYDEAIPYDPLNATLYRNLAELQEMRQNFPAAAATYELALDRLPEEHPDLPETRYRYGLAQVRNDERKDAERSLAQITDKARRLDLEGFIALHDGNATKALNLFSAALEAAADSEQQARIYYHASLAHHLLNNIGDSKNALFYAVNNASGLALKQHIRIFFDQIR